MKKQKTGALTVLFAALMALALLALPAITGGAGNSLPAAPAALAAGAPAVPQNLQAAVYNGSGLRLKQDYVYIGTAYKAAYYDGNCVPGVTYYYKVRAVSSANGSQYYSGLSASVSRQFTGAPKVPLSVKAAAYGERGIRLSWTASPGATQYNIYRYNGVKQEYLYIGTAYKAAYYDGSLAQGVAYYYKVRAIRKAGGATYVSGLSASVSAKTAGAPAVSYRNTYFGLKFPNKWGSNYKVNYTGGNFVEYAICNRYSEPLFYLSVVSPGGEKIYTSGLIGFLSSGGRVRYHLFLRRPTDLPTTQQHMQEYISMMQDVEFTRDVLALIRDGSGYSFTPVIGSNLTNWLGKPFSEVLAAFGSRYTLLALDTAAFYYSTDEMGRAGCPVRFVMEQRVREGTHANNHVIGIYVYDDPSFGNGLSAYMAYPDLRNALSGKVSVKEPTYSSYSNTSYTDFRLNGLTYTYVWDDVTYNRNAAKYVLITSF